MDDSISFKTDRVRNEWESGQLDPTVTQIVREAARFAADYLGWPFVLTCIHRTQGEDNSLQGSGIHPAWRAVDVRTLGRQQADVDAMTNYINGKYIYDPARPTKVVCYSKPHGDASHAHFQSFLNRTTLRPHPKGA